MEFHGQQLVLMTIKPVWQMNFMGLGSGLVTDLTGNIMTEQEIGGTLSLTKTIHEFSQFHKMCLGY